MCRIERLEKQEENEEDQTCMLMISLA